MAVFEIETPDGQRFQVEAPDHETALKAIQESRGATGAQGLRPSGQPTIEQPPNPTGALAGSQNQTGHSEEDLKAAARRAHADGNIDAARRLIAAARQAGASAAPPNASPAQHPYLLAPQQGTAALQEFAEPMRSSLVRGRAAIPAEMPLEAPKPFVQMLRDNIVGDDDDSTLNLGERLAAALNKGGENMTMGIVGDEMAGKADALLGRGSAEERTQFYRVQEAQLDEQHPVLSTTAAIGGALIGPGKGMAGFVNAGKGTAARILRGAGLGSVSGGTYGAMEGESADERITDGAIGAALGGAFGGVLTGVGQGFNAAIQRLSGSPNAREAIPTLQGLTDEAQSLYAAAERAGGVVPHSSVRSLAEGTRDALRSAGFNPRLHPRMLAVLDEMSELSAGPANLQAMDQLRRIASNAAQSIQKDERRLGSLVINRIDDAVEQMAGGDEVVAAREVWSRLQRMGTVEAIIEKASNSPNFETALASGFRSLLNRRGGARGFNGSEIAAMRQIASNGGTAGTLRTLGNLMAPDRFSGQILTGGALLGGGGIGSLAIPAAGSTMRGAGNRLQRRAANNVRDAVGQGDIGRRIVDAVLARPNPLASMAGASGVAGQDPAVIEAVSRMLTGSSGRAERR